jgi:hypothetical protein
MEKQGATGTRGKDSLRGPLMQMLMPCAHVVGKLEKSLSQWLNATIILRPLRMG